MKLIDYINKLFGSKPQLIETERHQLENDRTKLIEKMRKLYRFLETDFDYTYTLVTETDKYPGGPKYYINKYTNFKAQRQVEIVLHRNSTTVHSYLKRLQNNIEPSYSDNENCFAFYEIDIYNAIDNYDRHNLYLPPDYEFANVKVGLEILKSIPNILKGTDWLERQKLDKLFLETKGYKSGHADNPTLVLMKKIFSFLETDFNFKIVYDYDKLRPFEQDLGGELIYSNDKITIAFPIDFRDQDFCIYIVDTNNYEIDNYYQIGERVGRGQITETEFVHAKRQLEARLKNYYR